MPYLADTLSFLRILLAPVVLLFAVTGEWKTAWAALVVGWATDLLDGPAGRRYGSLRDRHPGLDMDGIADSALAFASAAVPVIYSARHRGWFDLITIGLITLYVITVLSAL
jgi:phosphatidylserine synthase